MKEIIEQKGQPEDESRLTPADMDAVIPGKLPRNMVLTYTLRISEHIDKLEHTRDALIERAVAEGITEDAFATRETGTTLAWKPHMW